MDMYSIIAVLIFGAIGGFVHQLWEAHIGNTKKNMYRGIIFGALGAYIAIYILNLQINTYTGYLGMVVGAIVFGYSGDSIVINYAKRKLKGASSILTEAEEEINSAMED